MNVLLNTVAFPFEEQLYCLLFSPDNFITSLFPTDIFFEQETTPGRLKLMLVVLQWYLVPQTATRLQLLSSLLPPLQSPAGPGDAELCPGTLSAAVSHPARVKERERICN